MESQVTSDIIAAFALFISAWALWDSRRSNRSSLRLSEQEIELVRHQLTSMRQSAEQEKRANVSAKMYKEGSNWRVRVYNSGPSDARNVRIVLDGNNQLITEGAINGKFPMERMEKGQSVDFWALVHLSSPKKEAVLIKWDDSAGFDRENRVEITI
jgi:hypothetical protein